jgi:sulfur relay (sulfurtransferase) DsrF/TusC family protein
LQIESEFATDFVVEAPPPSQEALNIIEQTAIDNEIDLLFVPLGVFAISNNRASGSVEFLDNRKLNLNLEVPVVAHCNDVEYLFDQSRSES